MEVEETPFLKLSLWSLSALVSRLEPIYLSSKLLAIAIIDNVILFNPCRTNGRLVIVHWLSFLQLMNQNRTLCVEGTKARRCSRAGKQVEYMGLILFLYSKRILPLSIYKHPRDWLTDRLTLCSAVSGKETSDLGPIPTWSTGLRNPRTSSWAVAYIEAGGVRALGHGFHLANINFHHRKKIGKHRLVSVVVPPLCEH